MEQNAYEALFLGVNVFVFIIALTAGILLMTNLMNMVNYANENSVVGMNGSLAESVGNVQKRIYTGAQIMTYYNKLVENFCKSGGKEQDLSVVYYVKTNKNGHEYRIDKYITGKNINCKDLEQDENLIPNNVKGENISNYYNNKFEMVYKGKDNNTEKYVFEMINE